MKTRSALFVLAALAGTASAFAHDGDGKVLDRKAPIRGPMWTQQTAGFNQHASAFTASGVQLLAQIPLNQFGAQVQSGSSGWGYVSPSGREYALAGHSHGISFVEITDPGNPVIVETIAGPNSLWHDVRTFGHYAYAVTEGGGGVQVIDMSQIDAGVVTLVNTFGAFPNGATHTIHIDTVSGFLYRAGGGSSQGIRIHNLNSNPTNPPLAGQWNTKYVHEVSAFTYTSGPYAGKQIAFACGGDNTGWTNTGLYVLDVTNKASIVQMSSRFWPQAGYSHQAWPTDDMKYLYINDELDESNFNTTTRTIVFDIQNLANPILLPSFTNNNGAIGHNLYVKGNRLFEANYTSGVRVFDITNPVAPTEIAWFDTWPASDAKSFNSLWNVYPYFPSGVVTGTDMEQGLFIWRVAGFPEPTVYCAAKVNSQGCTPSIVSSGSPSMSSGSPFTIGANSMLNNKSGLLFYGTNAQNAPFHGGTLCVASPFTRTTVQNSGGSSSGTDCTGTYAFDFNAYLASGADPALGAAVFVRAQYWSRDPVDAFGDSLSNGLWFSIGL